jgi:hypothetical protein
MKEDPCAGGKEKRGLPVSEPENAQERGVGGERLGAYQEIFHRVLGELKQNLAILEREAGHLAESLRSISAAFNEEGAVQEVPGESGREEEDGRHRSHTSRRRLWRIK